MSEEQNKDAGENLTGQSAVDTAVKEYFDKACGQVDVERFTKQVMQKLDQDKRRNNWQGIRRLVISMTSVAALIILGVFVLLKTGESNEAFAIVESAYESLSASIDRHFKFSFRPNSNSKFRGFALKESTAEFWVRGDKFLFQAKRPAGIVRIASEGTKKHGIWVLLPQLGGITFSNESIEQYSAGYEIRSMEIRTILKGIKEDFTLTKISKLEVQAVLKEGLETSKKRPVREITIRLTKKGDIKKISMRLERNGISIGTAILESQPAEEKSEAFYTLASHLKKGQEVYNGDAFLQFVRDFTSMKKIAEGLKEEARHFSGLVRLPNPSFEKMDEYLKNTLLPFGTMNNEQ